MIGANRRLTELVNRHREQRVMEDSLYATFLAHSRKYGEAFGIHPRELEDIRRILEGGHDKPLATVRILTDDHFPTYWYEFYVWKVCGLVYGGEWSNEIVCLCTDKAVNRAAGGGTTRITVVQDAHHRRLLEAFRGEREFYLQEEGWPT